MGNAEVGSDVQLLSMSKLELGKLLWGCGKERDEAAGISGVPVPTADGAFAERKSKPELGKLPWGCGKGRDEAAGISGEPVLTADGAFLEKKSESSSKVTHFWVCLVGAAAVAGTKDCCLEKDGGRVEL